ncbi:MAG: 2-oxoglutarate dehydrogenase E1 component [Pirellulales bacterium]|nr:2-oxoglutarate dehydrogenase E1 component [Pirellulales bacterium]
MNITENWPDAQNAAFVEELFQQYLADPQAVSEAWRAYFANWPKASGNGNGHAASYAATTAVLPAPSRTAETPGASIPGPSANGDAKLAADLSMAVLQDRVDQMVRAYRIRGHLSANIDPLGLARVPQSELDPDFYQFTEGDLDRQFSTRTIEGASVRTLRGIVEHLRQTYCRSIGVQFMHIDDYRVRHWLQIRMEGTANRLPLSREDQLRVLKRLTDAAIFEEFIQKKYVGAKRFSLEGAETLIPALDMAIESAGAQGIESVILAMAHRGRLNVLANIMGKSPNAIFREFDDPDPELHLGRGDVKYHLGYSNDWVTASGRTVHLSLCFNPSHLEFVNPVALGRMRAKQDQVGDPKCERGLTILIHGDAAFAGEGIVAETLNLSQLPGYSAGGALHIILNNQIGFTTTPAEARSNTYCTDVAKMLQIPIFHVNGEDPEAVAQCVQLALDFRMMFHRDVVIDMYCYRRYGHNEGDEPAFTQPMLYRAIENRKSVREGYLEHLLSHGEVTREEADQIAEQQRSNLVRELSVARSESYLRRPEIPSGIWSEYHGGPDHLSEEVTTGTSRQRLAGLLQRLTQLPADFHPHPKIVRWLKARADMAADLQPLDWSAAEALALATLLTEGHRVRLSGQDSQRGTFSHRHAVLHDVQDGHTYMPLRHLAPDQAPIQIYNSPLSETAVLGFDYGYSLDCPSGLVMWEAQFGDFSNVAQVIIDQFIASAEDKWRRLSGLVLLLPHGFEGMGPEHSSARMERFLALAAEDNLQIVNCTTPAQLFHCLRRQLLRPWRKPLVLFTPKSLLRHPQCISTLDELAAGHFQRIIPDLTVTPQNASRVLLCSGKVFYDLHAARDALKRNDDVAIIRVEQLYPLREETLSEALHAYPAGTPVYWVQEEPANMGAWRHMRVQFGETLIDRFPFDVVARKASASPATGSANSHKLEQEQLLARAFGVKSLRSDAPEPVTARA